MKIKHHFVVSIVITSILFSLPIAFTQAQTADEKQIREVRKQYNEAIAKHDSIAIQRFLTTDFHVISSRNSEVRSAEANQKFLAQEFRTKKDVVYVRTAQHVQVFIDWNMASETGTWTGQWQESDGLVKLSGTYYAKWHKLDGHWKIRAEIFTPLNCSGSRFCEAKPKIE
ncbi:MAG: YybH family protein [Flammeovirgaceae bacterium]